MNLPAQFVTLRWPVVLEWQIMLVDNPIWHDMSLADMSNKWCQSDKWYGNVTFSLKWFHAKLFKSFFSSSYWEWRLTLMGFSVSAKIHAWCIRMPCLSRLTSSWVVFAPQVKTEICLVTLSYMTMIFWLQMWGMGGTTDCWNHYMYSLLFMCMGSLIKKKGNNKTTDKLRKKMGSWVVGEVVDDGRGWGGCRWWQTFGML